MYIYIYIYVYQHIQHVLCKIQNSCILNINVFKLHIMQYLYFININILNI